MDTNRQSRQEATDKTVEALKRDLTMGTVHFTVRHIVPLLSEIAMSLAVIADRMEDKQQ